MKKVLNRNKQLQRTTVKSFCLQLATTTIIIIDVIVIVVALRASAFTRLVITLLY